MGADLTDRFYPPGLDRVCAVDFKDNAPSWQNDRLWQAAVATLRYLIHRHRHQLGGVKACAMRVETLVRRLEPAFDMLGREICTECTAPCCLTADVYYDFRDLLFLLLTGQAMPPEQPKHQQAGVCRYLGPEGCRIPRLERPWICTWYVCAKQKRLMKVHPEIDGGHLPSVIAQIGRLRKQTEALFVDIIS